MLDDNINLNPDNVTIIMGDFNARVGQDRRSIKDIIRPFGEEVKNTGENLIDLCLINNMKIMNVFF